MKKEILLSILEFFVHIFSMCKRSKNHKEIGGDTNSDKEENENESE